jgi:hypothetical protein
VMLNLVINAIQAMSDVRDCKRELHVTTGVVESGERVRVAVRDTGPGPSAENVEGLFQPFYTTKPDGLDVGLSCASRSVDDPDCVKTRMLGFSGAAGWLMKPRLCSDRFHQSANAQNAHDPFHVVGQDV